MKDEKRPMRNDEPLFQTTPPAPLPPLLADLAALGKVEPPLGLLHAVMIQTGLRDVYWQAETPIGRVFVAYHGIGTAAQISALWQADDAERFVQYFEKRFQRRVWPTESPDPVLKRHVLRRLAGERVKLQFDLRGLSDFEQAVLLKALAIPRGEVRPYSWIANEIEHPKAVRAVGTALGHNPIPLLIPCHRVVRSDGQIGRYVFGGDHKRVLLQAEGFDMTEAERIANEGMRYTGSDTTHIFCYPTCHHARRVTGKHRVYFHSEVEAQAAGYRPCKVCRPAV
jgi:O-6-methylguanine DNA methyltransferase